MADDPRGPWSTELRLLHLALEEGRIDERWLRSALQRGPYDDALDALTTAASALPSRNSHPHLSLLSDPDRRRLHFDRLSLRQRVGEAALFTLLQRGPEPSTLPHLLADGIEHGSVSITGALGLLVQCARDDELETMRLTRKLFSELSGRSVDLWGFEDDGA